MRYTGCILLLGFLAGNAWGASFDCDVPDQSRMEQLICNDSAVSALDDELTALYRQQRSKTSPVSEMVVASQKQWLKLRDRCLTLKEAVQCVMDAYRNRIKALGISPRPAVPVGDNIEIPLALQSAVNSYIAEPYPSETDEATEYLAAMSQLNSDQYMDAVVWLRGSTACGSGGCTLLVFKGIANGFELLSSHTLVQLPVYTLPESVDGWNSLIVRSNVSARSVAFVLRYDPIKRRYPSNPTLQKQPSDAQKSAAILLLDHRN